MFDLVNHSLLFKLTPSEIDSVCDDLRLSSQGYKLYYAVDSYDFVRFFLPYLEVMSLNKYKINKLAQESIAYESLFTDTDVNDESIILLDEYKKELLSVQDLFLSKVRKASELFKNSEELAKQVLNLINEGKDPIKVINQNYELFFLTLIFSQRKEDIKGISFLNFLKRKIHINQFDTNDEEFNVLADELFSQDYDKTFVETVYDEFIEKGFSGFKKINEFKLTRYLENTFLDIIAYQRLLLANEAVSKNKQYKKTIFYYLSSTPNKSSLLSEIILKKHSEKFSFFKIFQQRTSGIHRNIVQYFIFHRLRKSENVQIEKAIDFLQSVKKEIEIFELKNYNKLVKKESDQEFVYESLKLQSDKYLLEVENNFYLALVSNYKETLQRIILNGDSPNSDEKIIMNHFGEYLDHQIGDLRYTITKYERVKQILRIFEKTPGDLSAIRIRFPESDIIKFNFHHLPYLPFLYNFESHREYDSIFRAMSVISNIDDDKDREDFTLISFLRKLLSTKIRRVNEIPIEFLLLGYMDLLSIEQPGRHIEYDGNSVENELIFSLRSRRSILKAISELKKSKSHESITESAAHNDILYMLLWLYRRNKKYEEINKLENEILSLKNKDARLYHGLALGFISEFYYQREDESSKSKLQNAIEYLKIAGDEYELLLPKIQSKIVKDLVEKNLIGVYNSICNSLLSLYDFQKGILYIEEARFYLNKLHLKADQMGLRFEDFPILNNTEALFYCSDADFDLFVNGEYQLARKKYEYSLKRYQTSMSKPSKMNQGFTQKLKTKLENLADAISKYKKDPFL